VQSVPHIDVHNGGKNDKVLGRGFNGLSPGSSMVDSFYPPQVDFHPTSGFCQQLHVVALTKNSRSLSGLDAEWDFEREFQREWRM
jgi:hypothetical protein